MYKHRATVLWFLVFKDKSFDKFYCYLFQHNKTSEKKTTNKGQLQKTKGLSNVVSVNLVSVYISVCVGGLGLWVSMREREINKHM